MLTVSLKHDFSAGHRIVGLDGPGAKCTNLHGHTFSIEWTFLAETSDASDIEFGEYKKILRQSIDAKYDHAFFADKADTEVVGFCRQLGVKLVEFDGPPTTEAIVQRLAAETQNAVEAPLVSLHLTEGFSNAATWRSSL